MKTRVYVPLLALAVASGCAEFNPKPDLEAGTGPGNDVVRLSDWKYSDLEGGIQAESLMEAEVYGANGNEIGNVENLIINEQNQIVGLIAEVGGFWDIGDTHIVIPWSEVQVTNDGVTVPVTQQNYKQYGLYGEKSPVSLANLDGIRRVEGELETGPQTWKLTSLLGDYASLEDQVGYGYVDNVIFSQEGKIQAVVVESQGAAYAYPFYGYGYGWSPGFSTYGLPYGVGDVGIMEPFDYGVYGY